MKQNQFSEEQIPYHILNRFGLTREMIEDLPEADFEKLKRGGRTAMLPISVDCDNGDVVKSQVRISLVRDESGAVSVLFYPKLVKTDLSRFNDSEKKALEKGEVILTKKVDTDDRSVTTYHQIDRQTNQVVSVPASIIANNIQLVAERMKLAGPEKNSLVNGRLLTVSQDDSNKTIGISLKTQSGILITDGDEQNWREQERKDYARYSFGLNGCWVADDDGNLDYVPEDEYTEDMWDEMKKRGSMQRNAATHKM